MQAAYQDLRYFPGMRRQIGAMCQELSGDLGPGDYLVAIARKGPRILEALSRYWPELPLPTNGLISDLALPFLSQSADVASLRVFDDMAIYGSTMRDVLRKAERLTDDVRAYAIAVDAEQLLLAAPRHVVRLPHADMGPFCSEVVELIGVLPKPYDLDHPILYVDMPPHAEEDLWDAVRRGTLLELTTPTHLQAGTARYTVDRLPDLDTDKVFAPRTIWSADDLCKCRIYVDIVNRVIAIVPIFLFRWEMVASRDRTPEPPFVGELDGLNDVVGRAYRLALRFYDDLPGENPVSAAFEEAYRVALYLAEYVVGIAALHSVPVLEAIRQDPSGRELLDDHDLRLIFGRELGAEVRDAATQVMGYAAGLARPARNDGQPKLLMAPERTSARAELERLRDQELHDELARSLADRLSPKRGLLANLSDVFAAMHLSIDLPGRRREDSTLRRLRRGLLVQELRELLDNAGITISPRVFSWALDRLIDAGVVVPLRIVVGDPAIAATRLRFGESQRNLLKMQYAVVDLGKQLLDRLRTDGGLYAHIWQKVFRLVLSPLALREKFGDVFVEDFNTFGATLGVLQTPSEVRTADGETRLIQGTEDFNNWCENEQLVTRSGAKAITGVQHERFHKQHPEDESEIVPDNLSDASIHLVTVMDLLECYSLFEERRDVLLRLTTCRSLKAYGDALQALLANWFNHPADLHNFRHLLAALTAAGAGDGARTSHLDRVASALDNCWSYMEQVPLKKRVFNARHDMRDAVRAVWQRKWGRDPVRAELFQKHIEPLLKRRPEEDPSTHERLELLEALAAACYAVTQVVSAELAQQGLDVPQAPLLEEALSAWSAGLERLRQADVVLSVAAPSTTDYDSALAQADSPLEGVRAWAQEAYDDLVAVFDRRVAPYVRPPVLTCDQYRVAVVWDVMESSPTEATPERAVLPAELFAELQEVCAHLRDGELEAPTGNDAGSAVFRHSNSGLAVMSECARICRKNGFAVRAGICHKTDAGHLYEELRLGTRTGPPFVVAARAMVSREDEERPNEPMLLATEGVRQDVADSGPADLLRFFEADGRTISVEVAGSQRNVTVFRFYRFGPTEPQASGDPG